MRSARLVTLCLSLVTLLSTPLAAEPYRLIITEAEVPLVPNSVMELALQEGYFAREGVEVSFIRVAQTPMALAALRSGEGEMANISLDALLFAHAAGAEDLRAVMSPNKSLPYLIAGREGVSLDGLEGARFGIGRPGSADHLLALRVLEAAGLDPDKMQLLALGQPSARGQALVAGQIDATTLGIGSFTAIDHEPGISVLVSPEDFYAAAPVLSKLNVTRLDVLDQRRDETLAVTRALTLAARDFAKDPQLWVAAMRKARPDVAEADLQLLARHFTRAWSVNGGLSLTEIERAVTWLRADPEIAALPATAPETLADLSVIAGVLAQIGTANPGEAGADD